jgi:drug/metabolite transporter (DMT)-like permease
VSRRAWIVFAGVSALWGAPYLLIKIAVHDLSPTVIACSRTAIGAIALLPLAQRSGAVRPIRDRWRWLLLLAAVEMAVPFTLITAGERHIASSLAGILVSAAPLFVALFAIRVAPAERPRGVAVFGLVAGFAGVVVLLGAHVSGNGSEFLSAGAVLLAVAL